MELYGKLKDEEKDVICLISPLLLSIPEKKKIKYFSLTNSNGFH